MGTEHDQGAGTSASDWSLAGRRHWHGTRVAAHGARQQRMERQQAEWNVHAARRTAADTPPPDPLLERDAADRVIWPAAAALAFGGSAWISGLVAADAALVLALAGGASAALLGQHARRRMAILQADDVEPTVAWERATAVAIGLMAGLTAASRHLGAGAESRTAAIIGAVAIAGVAAGVLLWMISGLCADLRAQWLRRKQEQANRRANAHVVAAEGVLDSTTARVSPAIAAQAQAEAAAVGETKSA